MANSLNRTLKKGDHVVFNGGKEAVIDDDTTAGCHPTNAGHALSHTVGEESERGRGDDIDADETEKRFSEQNGWVSK